MQFFWKILGRDRHGRLVRPWALSAPVVVLIMSLPLLRPLRHPDPRRSPTRSWPGSRPSQAIVEHKTLAIEKTDFAPRG